MSLPASDNFPGSSLSANWTVDVGTFAVASNIVTTTGSGDENAHWNADVFPNDQYSQCTLLTAIPNNAKSGGLIVRATNSNHYYAFRTSVAAGTWTNQIAANHGTFNSLLTDSVVTWAINDVMKFQVVGNVLTVFKNGSQVLTFTDTNNFLTSGSAGIQTASSGTSPGLGVWSGGSSAVSDNFYGQAML